MKLRIHTYEKNVTKLGPGKRFTIWTQGCMKRCKGCISPTTQALDGGYEIETDELAQLIVNSNCEGITISGGEPFLQAKALSELIHKIKEKQEYSVVIYTGCIYEELKQSGDSYTLKLLEFCDLLIDGPYIEELNDGKNLRGSSNQRALALSDRYKAEASEYGTKPAEVEIFVHDGRLNMVGVPSKEQLEIIKKIT